MPGLCYSFLMSWGETIQGMPGAIGRELAAFWRWFWHGHAGGKTPWVRRVIGILFFFALPAPVLLLLIFRFVPIPGTPQMLVDVVMMRHVSYSWRSYDSLPPVLGRAVIGAEDENFCKHWGFDFDAIDKAMKASERNPNRRLRGASTISQQAARTLFLVNNRSWIRKGLETYITVLIEGLWPKKRILTAYLNLVDWGRGNYGADAAARAYFGKPATQITANQAARLAAILPNPDVWKAGNPGPYVAARAITLQARAAEVSRDGLDWCVR